MEIMDPFQLALAASDGVEGGVHVLEEDAAFPCELDAAGIPVEEPDAETFLKLADGFADSRLADVEFFGCLGNISGIGNRIKNPVRR